MTQVKSFVVGFSEGLEGAIKLLDEQTKELNAKVIHSVKDTYYNENVCKYDPGKGPSMVRVVIFEK